MDDREETVEDASLDQDRGNMAEECGAEGSSTTDLVAAGESDVGSEVLVAAWGIAIGGTCWGETNL